MPEKLLFNVKEIDAAISVIANKINQDYANNPTPPLILCVMVGGMIFTSQLALKLTIPVEMDHIQATRYNNSTIGSTIKWLHYPNTTLANKDIIIVDDILDGGLTLTAIIAYCQSQNPSSIKTAVLLDKTNGRIEGGLAQADYTGLSLDKDHYVFGFGMDCKKQGRNRNGIFARTKEDNLAIERVASPLFSSEVNSTPEEKASENHPIETDLDMPPPPLFRQSSSGL